MVLLSRCKSGHEARRAIGRVLCLWQSKLSQGKKKDKSKQLQAPCEAGLTRKQALESWFPTLSYSMVQLVSDTNRLGREAESWPWSTLKTYVAQGCGKSMYLSDAVILTELPM